MEWTCLLVYKNVCAHKSLRIQVCPKKGINPTILLWGWDWDHQTYSREGYGSLGRKFIFTLGIHKKPPWTLLILLREKRQNIALFEPIPRPSRGESGSDAPQKGWWWGTAFVCFRRFFLTFYHGKSISKGNPLFHYFYGRPDHARPFVKKKIGFFVCQIQGFKFARFRFGVRGVVPSPFSAQKQRFFSALNPWRFLREKWVAFEKSWADVFCVNYIRQ